MKVRVDLDKGETLEQAEEKLEKALEIKRKVKEEQYARESYKDSHFDEFHDYLTSEHEKLASNVLAEIGSLIKGKLR